MIVLPRHTKEGMPDAHVASMCAEREILLAKCYHSETFPVPDINY